MIHSIKIKEIEKNSFAAEAYKSIKELVLSKNVKDKINQEEIASKLGISRTPVVIALNQLASEGYLTQIPYKGFYVKEYSRKELEELNEVRILYEKLGIKKMIQALDEKKINILEKFINDFEESVIKNDVGSYRSLDIRFHNYLVKQTENQYIIGQYLDSIAVPNITGSFIPIKDSLIKHKKLVKNIISKNEKAALDLIEEHISSQLY